MKAQYGTIEEIKKHIRILLMENQKTFRQAEFISSYIQCGCNKQEACKVTSIPESTVYRWFKDDEAFKEKLSKSFAEIELPLLEEATRRALKGSDILLIFLLKAARPERYCDQARKAKLMEPALRQNRELSKEEIRQILLDDPFVDWRDATCEMQGN